MKKKRNFREIHNDYKKFKEEDNDINKLYNLIKIEYLEEENLNIYLEKIYLNKKLNGEKSKTDEINNTVNIILITTIIGVIIDRAMPDNPFAILMVAISSLIFNSIISFITDRKKIKKEYNEYLYYKICLMVIEELEKEKENSY